MKKLSLRSLIPNLFTFFSLTLGLTALKFAIESKWQISVSLVVFASFLDNIDGKIARLLKSNSNFGVELDSLSDLISFGVTPAIIVYLWSKSLMIDGVWAMVIFYAICSSSRLAKFNITSHENKSEKDIRFFSGISTPAAAGLTLLPMMLNFRFNVEIFLNEYFIKFYLLIPSILMITNIPTFSLKGIKFEKKLIPLVIILLASFLSLLLTDFWLAMIILISVYFLSIPLAFYDFKKS
ncbi:MAG: CDP-alcohol phosphatidyltransferase family protein [Alphaproteobacteria bacterium]|jgi:CDP-diacylglycerol--serine O-phosphatidyltransferase|tara:strand:- start:371 stop:1084 length:714 start_codon:yes stop_codon:yes gene_type:complete